MVRRSLSAAVFWLVYAVTTIWASATVYTWTDEDGTRHFSDHPPPSPPADFRKLGEAPDPERISPPEGKETLFSGRVVVVSSGDALTVLRDGKVIDLLLHGVDCPEPGQPFHDEARAFATRLCFDRTVNVRPVRTDPRGRTVAIVYLEDRRELNYELLKAGLAWYHRRFAVDDMYDAAERHARRAGRGLWGQPDPTPPWKYRRRGPPFR